MTYVIEFISSIIAEPTAVPAAGPRALSVYCASRLFGYRVMYVAKFEESVYVLHCFKKKTSTTQ